MDLDGDGQTDILSGSYSPGDVYLFAGKPDGSFAAGLKLALGDGRPLEAGRRTIPFACDWDSDGLADLLVGTMEGQVLLFRNQGAPGKLALAPATPLLAAGQPVKVSAYAAPSVADWDGDGLPDLLVGENSGAIHWFRNTGSLGKPLLAAPAALLPAPAGQGRLKPGEEPGRSGGRPFLSVVDWNRDGVPDLLVGDCQFQEGVPPDPPAVDAATLAAAAKRQAELQRLLQPLARAPQGEAAEARESRLKRVQELRKELSETAAILRQGRPPLHVHGWVWLYLGTKDAPVRKQI